MKKWVVFVLILSVSWCAYAVPDIQFTPGGDSPGQWYYDGTGTFSFSQDICIDLVQGGTTDALMGSYVFLPNLQLSNYNYLALYNIGVGDISANGDSIELKDGIGNVLLSGTLRDGGFSAQGTTGAFFSDITLDILVNAVNPSGSAFLTGISAGDYFDFNLTIQGNQDLNVMIQNNDAGWDGFSGSMSFIVPEPATLLMLVAGGLLLPKRK